MKQLALIDTNFIAHRQRVAWHSQPVKDALKSVKLLKLRNFIAVETALLRCIRGVLESIFSCAEEGMGELSEAIAQLA